MKYDTLNDALRVASEDQDALRHLASHGPGSVLVAEVIDEGDGYKLDRLYVTVEGMVGSIRNGHIVARA